MSALTPQLQQVEDDDGPRDEESLSGLNAIDARQDVYSVGAEHRQHAHVDIVEDPYRNRELCHFTTFFRICLINK